MGQNVLIDVNFLRPGMCVAEDVYRANTLLVSKGIPLTASLILCLKSNDIKQITIFIEPTDTVRGLEHTYHLTIALIKKFLLDFKEFRSIHVEVLDEIVAQLSQSQNKLQLFELTHLMRCKDEYTYNHSLSVALLTLMLGEWMEYEPHENLILAGLLHDVGKLEIDDAILCKPGPLTRSEWTMMREHPLYSAAFIQNEHQFGAEIIDGALYHHERQDGSGYPYGLKGEEIPRIARIISICDVFDAMTSRRPYKKGDDIFRVLKYLYSCNTLFDWRCLDTFVLNMLELLTGENVILNTGQKGKLIFINRFSPFEPLVKVDTQYLDLAEDDSIQIESVALAHSS